MLASSAKPASSGHRRRVLLSVFCFALAGVATVALWPLLGPAVAHAAEGLGRIRPELLILSGALFAAAPLFCGLAWREAILRAGGQVGRVDACARYGVGSLVNSVAPFHLGDIARAVLLLEKLPAGGRRRIVPWFGVIQGARLAALATLAIAAALPGLPDRPPARPSGRSHCCCAVPWNRAARLPRVPLAAGQGRGDRSRACRARRRLPARRAWPSSRLSSLPHSSLSRRATSAWRAPPPPARSSRRDSRCPPQFRPVWSYTRWRQPPASPTERPRR